MPVDRPTFSESWYRVAELRPRLRSTVQLHRQHFRGRLWHVVQDPANNQFFRLDEPAYRLVALLDGRRTVAEAWQIANQDLGDQAPTQGEAIQLLGQLFVANLIQGDLPPDTEAILRRYRQRTTREMQGRLTNLLFIRLPLLDPDRFLDRWLGLFGRLFTWYGFAFWLALVGAGLWAALGRWPQLVSQTSDLLSRQELLRNLPLMYLGFILIKVVHEFGHAFACKKFGRQEGSGGEVHVMGLMLLVFTPVPYVDASSAWALRDKWRRVMVGAGGVFVEIAVAAVAAIVWANTSDGPLHALCYNLIFLAGFSTLLFNGNPLLRYDAYYVLSDLLEIPNLAQRSKQYLYYLVKRYAWGVRRTVSPAHTRGEKIWLALYGVASTVYRVLISVAILLFIADKLFFVGLLLALAAAVGWVVLPFGKFIHYLFAGPELSRVRGRAVATTMATLALAVIGVGFIPAPDRFRAEGVVEPLSLAMVHAQADGFVTQVMPSGSEVVPGGPPLVIATNADSQARHQELLAERRRLAARRRLAQTQEPAAAQIVARQLSAIDEKIAWTESQLADLSVRAPRGGLWISPEIDRLPGAYVRRGDRLGMVATPDQVMIRATVGQDVAALLMKADRETGAGDAKLRREPQVSERVEIRVRGRPQLLQDRQSGREFRGTVTKIIPAGQEQLPSAALGYGAGGAMLTAPDDQQGLKTAERFFEIQITPDADPPAPLLCGQRVVVRFEQPRRPLAAQWWRSLLQMVQRRYHLVGGES